jgi:hypothetical protein
MMQSKTPKMIPDQWSFQADAKSGIEMQMIENVKMKMNQCARTVQAV